FVGAVQMVTVRDGARPTWIVGITGASGVVYGIRLIHELLAVNGKVHLTVTEAGWRVLRDELQWHVTKRQDCLQRHFSRHPGVLIYHPIQDIGASIASGSFLVDGMVV